MFSVSSSYLKKAIVSENQEDDGLRCQSIDIAAIGGLGFHRNVQNKDEGNQDRH